MTASLFSLFCTILSILIWTCMWCPYVSQSYHFARALGQLSQIYGRVGLYDKAFSCFEKMRLVYLPDVHPNLLSRSYGNQDKCAHWYVCLIIMFINYDLITITYHLVVYPNQIWFSLSFSSSALWYDYWSKTIIDCVSTCFIKVWFDSLIKT